MVPARGKSRKCLDGRYFLRASSRFLFSMCFIVPPVVLPAVPPHHHPYYLCALLLWQIRFYAPPILLSSWPPLLRSSSHPPPNRSSASSLILSSCHLRSSSPLFLLSSCPPPCPPLLPSFSNPSPILFPTVHPWNCFLRVLEFGLLSSSPQKRPPNPRAARAAPQHELNRKHVATAALG